MQKVTAYSAFLFLLLILTACAERESAVEDIAPDEASGETDVSETPANLLELRAVGLRFEGPNEIASGWVTIRLENLSSMVHLALVDKLPAGISLERMEEDVVAVFQRGMDRLNAGDQDGAMEIFGGMPEYAADIVYTGGPGLLSGGHSSESTVFLEPGLYQIECYVKTNGVFHTYDADPGELGMVHELIVTEEVSPAPAPVANLTIEVSSDGLSIVEGALRAGRNTIRAQFPDQKIYPHFVGHDVHVFRVDADTDLAAVGRWMDWRSPDGLETPAPAEFLGGINDMPAGTTAYFSVELSPGDYAFIAEVPAPAENGFLLPFKVEP